MGKSLLLLPNIAIVLLSLISVDSTNSIQQIDSHEIYHSSISIIQLKYINLSHSCKFKSFNQIKNQFHVFIYHINNKSLYRFKETMVLLWIERIFNLIIVKILNNKLIPSITNGITLRFIKEHNEM